jgi:hypothetical protein
MQLNVLAMHPNWQTISGSCTIVRLQIGWRRKHLFRLIHHSNFRLSNQLEQRSLFDRSFGPEDGQIGLLQRTRSSIAQVICMLNDRLSTGKDGVSTSKRQSNRVERIDIVCIANVFVRLTVDERLSAEQVKTRVKNDTVSNWDKAIRYPNGCS